jgi:Malectin domain
MCLFSLSSWTETNKRVFDAELESATRVSAIDIVQLGGGMKDVATKVETSAVVNDGNLLINFLPIATKSLPLISAIYANRLGPPPPPVAKPPTKAPTKSPTKLPTKAPVLAPVKPPTVKPPTKAPTKAPTKRPTRTPTKAPIVPFDPVLINCGYTSNDYTDSSGRVWKTDRFNTGGTIGGQATEGK